MLCLSFRERAKHMAERTHLSIRMDKDLHDKFQHIAAYEGRSMSGQILHMIKRCVTEFEKEHGPITEEDLK